jgi:hypothetical protein
MTLLAKVSSVKTNEMKKHKLRFKMSWKDFQSIKRRTEYSCGLDGWVFWREEGEDVIVVQVQPNPEVTKLLKEKGKLL